jgi:hypothetical protein
MTTETKAFHLSAVLSITTGRMVAINGMDDIYQILNFMCQDNLFTHQLPRAMKECAPYLIEKFPQLKDITCEGITRENHKEIIEALCTEHGDIFLVTTLPQHAHEYIDPMSELAEKMHPSQTIQISTGE